MNATINNLNYEKALLIHQIECTLPTALPTDEQLINLGSIQLEIHLEKKIEIRKTKNIFDENQL